MQNHNPPLAEKLRPKELSGIYTEENLHKVLLSIINAKSLSSVIFWGPSGSGKTTVARSIGHKFSSAYEFVELSAVMSGVKDIKELAERSKEKPVILFLDEIHRFNKTQQDSLLPHVEDGSIVLIGATTENPSFSIISPLLSRARVVVFPSLSEESLKSIGNRALDYLGAQIEPQLLEMLVGTSGGDARKLINIIENLSLTGSLTEEGLKSFYQNTIVYDKSGENHYDFASALIKSIRGSDPDAALFYAFKMIEAGEDPRFIFRRLIILASEDIGNADPNALRLAVAGADAFERIGMPEGKIPLAQLITYLAACPKSNRSYVAMHRAIDAVSKYKTAVPPMHLRNAPTKLMKELNYGKGYQYPHDTAEGYVKGVRYMPDEVKEAGFYEPSNHGLEAKIKERLALISK